MLLRRDLNARQLLRRLFKSQWLRIFGPAIILLEIIAAAGVALTGNWNLLWFIPYFIVLFVAIILIRLVIIAFLGFFPVWIAILVVWAAFILFKGKRQKKANIEASTRGPATSSDAAQQERSQKYRTMGRAGRYGYNGIPLPGIGYVEPQTPRG